MSTTFSPPIAAYMHAANAHDTSALLGTFTTDAVVTDEGREYRGHKAIRNGATGASRHIRPPSTSRRLSRRAMRPSSRPMSPVPLTAARCHFASTSPSVATRSPHWDPRMRDIWRTDAPWAENDRYSAPTTTRSGACRSATAGRSGKSSCSTDFRLVCRWRRSCGSVTPFAKRFRASIQRSWRVRRNGRHAAARHPSIVRSRATMARQVQ